MERTSIHHHPTENDTLIAHLMDQDAAECQDTVQDCFAATLLPLFNWRHHTLIDIKDDIALDAKLAQIDSLILMYADSLMAGFSFKFDPINTFYTWERLFCNDE